MKGTRTLDMRIVRSTQLLNANRGTGKENQQNLNESTVAERDKDCHQKATQKLEILHEKRNWI